MSEHKFRLIPGNLMYLSLARDRFVRGLQTEQWAERYPDHFVVVHDHEALAFTETLSQTQFQLDEAERRRIHPERIFVFYIGGPSVSEDGEATKHVREQIRFIEEHIEAVEPSRAVATIEKRVAPEDWPAVLRALVRADERELFAAIKELGLAIDPALLALTEKIFHDIQKAFPDGLPAETQGTEAA